MAKKLWIQGAISNEGRVRKHLDVKEGEKIPADKLNAEIARLRKKTEEAGGSGLSKDEKSLYSALVLAKRLRKFSKSKKG